MDDLRLCLGGHDEDAVNTDNLQSEARPCKFTCRMQLRSVQLSPRSRKQGLIIAQDHMYRTVPVNNHRLYYDGLKTTYLSRLKIKDSKVSSSSL